MVANHRKQADITVNRRTPEELLCLPEPSSRMPNPQPTGRLELTWTNKHLRLLSHEDGSYQWVDPSDHRVAEVRLLREAARVRGPEEKAGRNLLVRGDALHALQSLSRLPEYASEFVGKVRLVYIDPPFNTQQSFMQYDDALEHSVWLTMMRDRLLQTRKLLSETGSVWVHLDDSEMAYCRVLLDEVFGRENFVAKVIWQKTHTRENRTDISTSHEYIIIMAKNRQVWRKARNLLPPSDEQLARYTNPDDDPRGPWSSMPVHAKAEKGRRAAQFYDIETPAGRTISPPPGNCWRFTKERFEEMVRDDRIWFGEDGGNVPRLKKFLSEVQVGLVPVTIWPYEEVGTTGEAKGEIVQLFPDQTPFSTPKPERLMERIIHIATAPGDLVMDFFGGSGTTAAVAHKMGRRWMTVERSEDTLSNFTLPRLKKVVRGEDTGGISKALGWKGGGSFEVLDVAPSMFEEEEGVVFLARWAAGGELGEATAAQLGFEFQADSAPFCGRKGRCRLAVIDGHVNGEVVELLASLLGEDETMVVCGTSLDPNARASLPSGCEIKKIPNVILDEYRKRYRVRRRRQLGLRSTQDTPELKTPA